MERRNGDGFFEDENEPKELTDGREIVVEPGIDAAVGELEPQGMGVMDLIARHRIIVAALFVVLALVSLFPVREVASAPETYTAVIQTLDEKKGNVMALMAASTVASAGVSLLPDDTGTPIAEKLIDLSGNLAIVLGVIYLEKYLLTIFGTATFGLLVPVACVLIALAALLYRRSCSSTTCARIAAKLALLGIVLVITIPTSVGITNQIDAVFDESVSIAETQSETVDESAEQTSEEGDQGFDPLAFIQGIPDAIASIPETVTNGVASVSEEICSQVNRLIEQFAVMIVTSCVIPILVLLFFLWMANLLLGIDVSTPVTALQARGKRLATLPKMKKRDSKAIKVTKGK